MAYGFLVFERPDLVDIAADLDKHMADIPPANVVSISHAMAQDEDGFRYSTVVVYHD